MLIEVWYHKVMNEKSIHAPFVPDKRKFCIQPAEARLAQRYARLRSLGNDVAPLDPV